MDLLKRNCVPDFVIDWLRFLSLVIGVVDVTLTLNSYAVEYRTEVLFCVIVISAFLFSCFIFIFHLIDYKLGNPEIVNQADIVVHGVFALSMIVVGLLMLGAAIDRPGELQGIQIQRLLAAFFGVENGITYAFIGLLLYRKTVQQKMNKHGEGLEWEDPLVLSQESNKTSFGSI